MSSNYIVVRDGVIENIIVWDGVSKWIPPEGCIVLPADDNADMGALWDGEKSVRVEKTPSVESMLKLAIEIQKEIDALSKLADFPGAVEKEIELQNSLLELKANLSKK